MASSLYKLGTVAVTNNSAVVTGTDTSWLSTDIRNGDIVYIVGDTTLYFVETRDSMTQITLDRPYEGTTGTGKEYVINRMAGDWGTMRVLGLETAEYVKLFHADTLTQTALDEALADIEAALALINMPEWLNTAGMPSGATGNVGDWAMDPDTGDVYSKTGVSTWTLEGNFKGANGDPGSQIYIDTGVPSGVLGVDGDIYLDDNSSILYKKVTGSWVSQGPFVGAVDDATDAAAAAAASASSASTSAGTATTQAGIATTQAGTATTQAGTATTQAGIATTQAGIATAAAAIAGGYRYLWDTGTASSDPGSGKIRINNAALASATAIYISETDKSGAGIAAVIASWDDSTSTIRGYLTLREVSTPTNFAVYAVTGTNVDGGAWDTVNVTHLASGGSFAASDDLSVEFYRTGDLGTVGSAPGVYLRYSTSTTDSDPGIGLFRLNNSVAASTQMFIDNNDINSSVISSFIDTWDDSTSPIRGYVYLRGVDSSTKWALFSISGSVVDGTGYRKITVANLGVGGSWANNDLFSFQFTRTGDAGAGSVNSVNGDAGPVIVLTTDDISDAGQTNKWATAAEKTKLGFISVTQAVDLDAIETNSNASKTKTDLITVTQAVDLDAIETKTDYLTVTQAVDLDSVEAQAAAAAPQVTTYTKVEVDNLITSTAAGVAKRGTVRAATTANITIATALNNADVLDGVTLATGDLVLVKNQTAPQENGIYVVGVTPVRAAEFDTYNEHPGALIVVQEGTTNADTFWYCTSNVGGTLNTTGIVFAQLSLSPADDSITNAKLANMANATVKGRTTAGTGDPEDLTMAQLKTLLALAAADIVSGNFADARMPVRLQQVCATITDWNNAIENGWYMAAAASNAPNGSVNWFYGSVITHNTTPGYCTQTVYDFSGAAPHPVWRRQRSSGTWTPWIRLRQEGVLTPRGVSGTTDTLVYPDQGGIVEFQNASATTVTIPPNSSVAFPVDTIINLMQYGAGQVTVAPGAGVTIRSAGSRLKLTGQYSSASIRKRATDEWWLFGDITT